jgi:RNA polymerase sigma-70 factor, ECF subfamily
MVTVHDEDFASVLAAARSGQEWAIAGLYDGLQPALLRYLRSQESQVADDLASETWLAVAKGLGGFEGDEAAFRAWVFSIARRRLADHRRMGARRRTHPVADIGFAEISASAPDPADVVTSRASAQEAIDRVVALLPDAQAEVFVLRIVGGLSVEEVARIVGKRAGTVRVLQHRALRRLSAQVERHSLLEA